MIQNNAENVGASEARGWKFRPLRIALLGSVLALLLSFRPSTSVFVSIILAPYAIAGAFLGMLAIRAIALKNPSLFSDELVALIGAAAAIAFPLLLTATMAVGLPLPRVVVLPLLLIIGDTGTSYQENLRIAPALSNLFLQGLLVSIAMIKLGVLRSES
jgi:hypothetical protein